jgi:uncharacterized protein YjbJ (UPF0337 family)
MGAHDIQNKAEEWKGAAKETIGDATDNKDMQAEGAAEKAKAQTKENLEDVQDTVEDAARNAEAKARNDL